MPYLAKIIVYPIKSLDGVAVTNAKILDGGSLAHDREFAIVDDQGQFVNGKRTAQIHKLRSTFDLDARTVTMRVGGDDRGETFHLDDERSTLGDWLSDYFGYRVKLEQNLHMGFPDDTDASGPTVVSTATLETVTSWFPDLNLDQIRWRFRTNLEIAEAPEFWEEQLVGEQNHPISFQIGMVNLLGRNPCQRCIVPTRDPQTGESYDGFQKTFTAQRKTTLPMWVRLSRFNHVYRLTLNTSISASEAGKYLHVGDRVTI